MYEMMQFPNTVEEFMEQYKIVDTEQIYTNGAELVPIFRMKQWFDYIGGRMIDKEDAVAIVRVVILHHFSPEYDAELNKEALSKWDKELFTISNEICTKIRGDGRKMIKYIDAEVLKNNIHNCIWTQDTKSVEKFVNGLPAADVVEVVRCKDCKYQNKGQNECEVWNMCEYRSWLHYPVNDDDYCSKGERNE